MSDLLASIVIPACNEEASISGVISNVKKLNSKFEIIVVDDGSTDKTSEIIKQQDVTLIQHESNRGYGASLKSGIRAASNEVIVILDGDGTYPIEMIPQLIQNMETCDMVVGARNKRSKGMSGLRLLAKGILNIVANYLTNTKIPDINSGLRAFKRRIALSFFNILPSGFSFTTTITLAMLTNHYNVKYIPIEYFKRHGKSKIRPIRDTAQFLSQIFRTVMYFNPMKVFLPLSSIMFLIGVGIFVYTLIFTDKILDTTVLIIVMTAIQLFAIGLLAELIEKRSHRINDN